MKQVTLRRFRISDLERLFELFANDNVLKYLSFALNASQVTRKKEIEWLKKVWWCRTYGYWFYNDGEPTFLPPDYFDFLKLLNKEVIFARFSPIEQFSIIKNSKKIILSPSTFSWWAAFLSDANEIYYPLYSDFFVGLACIAKASI